MTGWASPPSRSCCLSPAAFYDGATVQRIDLELGEESLAALRADPESYVPGVFVHADTRIEDIGIKLAGGDATFRTLDEKASFRLKLDEYDDGTDYAGLERINLHNMEDDPAQGREVIAYAVWNASGQLAPLANYAEVYVNGESYGVYANVEEIDDAFLARHTPDPSGDLWEAGIESDFTPGGVLTYTLVSGLGDEEALDAARRQIQGAEGAFYEVADEVVDMDAFLDFWAWQLAIGNEDVYPYDLDDHTLYQSPVDGRYGWVPSSMDESWNSSMDGEAYTGTLAVHCAYDAACEPLFRTHLSAVLTQYEGLDVPAIASDALALSVGYVQLDTRRSTTLSEVVTARSALLTLITGRPNVVRGQWSVE